MSSKKNKRTRKKTKEIPPVKPEAKKKPPVKPEVVDDRQLDAVREEDMSLAVSNQPVKDKQGNFVVNNLNVIIGPLKEILDPIHKVCYEPIKNHYREKYRKPYGKHASKVLIFDMFLLTILGALAVVGIFAYLILPVFPQPKLVSLQTISPTSLVSGQPSAFMVSYVNDSDQPLADASLEMRLPAGFLPAADANDEAEAGVEVEAEPEDASVGALVGDQYVRRFSLGSIPPNGRGEARLEGRLFAPIGSHQSLSVTMLYWKPGSTEPQRLAEHRDWLVEDSLFHLALRPEKEIVRGRSVSIGLPYGNLDERPVQASLRLTPPDDFVVTGASRARSAANEWNLGELDPGERGLITVYGYFRNGTGRPAVPSFTVSAYVSENGKRYLAQEIRQSIEALSGGFSMEQTLVRPSAASAVSAGDELVLAIRYRNNGHQPLSNIRIRLETDERLLDGSPALSWDSQSSPELESLEAKGSGALTARLKLADPWPLEGWGERPEISLKTVAEYVLADDPNRPVLAETSTISLPVNTTLKLKGAALYWTRDGDQVGSGPLPPRVGQTTKYRAFIQLGTSLNRLDEVTFEAYLPPEVEWTGHYSVSVGRPPAFLPAERRLVWQVETLNADPLAPEPGASFELALTPQEKVISPVLMKGMRLCGRDAVTGVRICADAGPITSNVD